MKFYKYEGCGNDFIIVLYEDIKHKDISEICKEMCQRHYHIGADGLIVLDINPYKMTIYNKDGTKAIMCGNGIRCVAQFIKDYYHYKYNTIDIYTDDGIKHIEYKDNKIKVCMGTYDIECIEKKNIEMNNKYDDVYILNQHVPHAIYMCEHFFNVYSLSKYLRDTLGHKLNINFVLFVNRKKIKVRTYEKGAGMTLACGSGACASAYILYSLGMCDKEVEVEMLGGNLNIEIDQNVIYMEGTAQFVFSGEYKERRTIYE